MCDTNSSNPAHTRQGGEARCRKSHSTGGGIDPVVPDVETLEGVTAFLVKKHLRAFDLQHILVSRRDKMLMRAQLDGRPEKVNVRVARHRDDG